MGRRAVPLSLYSSILVLLGLLSWAPVKSRPAEWVLAALLCAAFLFALRKTAPPRTTLPPIPSSWFFSLLAVAALLRFIPLLFWAWPFIDEADMAWAAVKVMEGRDHGWFFVKSRTPPLYPWMLAGLFKMMGVTLFSMRLLPALLSAASVFLCYPAAKAWMEENQARWAALFAAFSFPFLFFGELGFAAVSVVPAFLAAAWLLGSWLGPEGKSASLVRAALFGLSLGAGFYTYHPWPAASAFFLILAAALAWRRARRAFLPSLAIAALVFLPFLSATLKEGTASYWAGLGFWRLPLSWGQWSVAFSYIRVALWGLGDAYHTYKPVWGGFLNPVAGTLYLAGWVAILRSRRKSLVLWTVTAHLLLILPAALSLGWMPVREALWFPLFPAVMVLGVPVVAGFFRGRLKILAPALLLLVCSSLDLFHFFNRYPAFFEDRSRWSDYGLNTSYPEAYELLEQERRDKGAGLLFLSWVTGRQDLSLRSTVYSFNAADNPRLDGKNVSWTAVLCNVHYLAALKAALPGGWAYALAEQGRVPPDGGLMLYVADVSSADLPRLRSWREAVRSLESYEVERLERVPGRPYGDILSALESARDAHARDALLGWFWAEKAADEWSYDCLVEGRRDAGMRAADILRRTASTPDAPANLSYRRGAILEYLGDVRGAREAYRMASKSPMDLTDSKERLRMLGNQ